MTPEEIAPLFHDADGGYRFARWGRPIVPVVFGVEDATLSIVKGAVEAVVTLAQHRMAETDPELGANLMVFFFREWAELTEVPDLDRMIPGLSHLVTRLEAQGANVYRTFRFDAGGAIRASFIFLRMGGELSKVPAETLALAEMAQMILLWSDRAFAERSPLAVAGKTVILRPAIAAVIRAAYDPILPDVAHDSSHALRLSARIAAAEG